ncbi:lytic transglycosylase domain-containing protein [Acetobacter pasteurianus]|uniref:Murein transglycosylase n=1 Tax=Acetobacter pasteurianus (strain NBRC 105184 / IFO 3283-01) TaxID=634452 RepID=C7JF19_ACEP3|nr:murein transglycosylase [Acetobacter pasteurianus IFO 3283-01]BAI03460.1 murein transglycosylase [Acetobacter pasteurianus IFO 3283-03]BAI06505.1 murein transglycosylase [Acetobacter pasteurianus IFO 3283-07]BAI09555.1 murein transglycosylase [Acetobacter pasteurianus IFO 3283-22]BAI12603.1 murein transglycosylase [Acetobacter pasteurianus IFO 3283-26]BAI15649.1 murein transglycosylase [Acetobacter pasteurianus IFO 3283-32]BAI18630.1 murein transglycosylase [Acetobacter pasteurianus IFO 32
MGKPRNPCFLSQVYGTSLIGKSSCGRGRQVSFRIQQRQTVCAALLLGLAGCATPAVRPGGYASYQAAYERSEANPAAYRPVGPAEDPWGPYIKEAAQRFSIPESWIRAVMQQESGGHQYLDGQLTTSSAGAMGLMQLMPATYADMQSQFNLGGDPYNPHDNIMAGAGYIRQMYDHYGAPGFLAAYNAGPQRVDDYLTSGRTLPDETVNYVASITPHLGTESAPAGSFAPAPSPVMVASAGSSVAAAPVAEYARADLSRTADGCLRDPDAAYDPSTPCLMDRDTPHPDPQPVEEAAPIEVAQAQPAGISDQAVTATPLAVAPAGSDSPPVQTAAYNVPSEQRRYARSSSAHVLALPSSSLSARSSGAVQVGAFASYAEAQHTLESVNRLLTAHALSVRPTVTQASVAGRSYYRAQFITAQNTGPADVCQVLRARALPCIQVRGG